MKSIELTVHMLYRPQVSKSRVEKLNQDWGSRKLIRRLKIMMRSIVVGIICFATYRVPSCSAATTDGQMSIGEAYIEANFEPSTNVHYGSVNLIPKGNDTDVLNRIECENGVIGNVWLKNDTRRYMGEDETLFIPASGLWVGPVAGSRGFTLGLIDDAHLVFRNLPEHLAMDGHVKCNLSFERAGRIDVDFSVIRNMEQLISF